MKHLRQLGILGVLALAVSSALAQAPTTSADYLKRGDAKYYEGDLNAAVADYDKAIELDPTNAGAYFRRGVVHDRKDETEAAIADYTRAIELKPRNTFAYNNRAM